MISQNDPAGLAHAKKLIKENLETQAPFLDLGNCRLVDLSELPELWECQHLEGLNMGTWYWQEKKYQHSKNNFGYNLIEDKGAKTITQKLGQLTSLNLQDNRIGYDGAKAIANNLEQLTALDLGTNIIGDRGVIVIAEKLEKLTSLYLWENQIKNKGATAIAKSLGKLTCLHLGDNNIKYEGALAIAESLGKLTSLHLGSNHIGYEGVKAIAKNLKQLTSLYLWSNEIGTEGAKAIGESLEKLTSLHLGSNQIGDKGLLTIAKNLVLLTSLNLNLNKIGDEGALAVAENLIHLTSLNLGANQIGDVGAKVIAKNLSTLTSLDLCENQIGDEGAKFIAENLKNFENLNLADNKITNFDPFLPIIKNNLELKLITNHKYVYDGINLAGNPLTEPPIEVLKQGREAIIEFYRQKEFSGSKLLLEAKMVLLGDGRAGKSSLACRLLKNELPKEEDRTKGVDIVIGEYSFPVDEGEFTLNIWDFAGQDKYKPLHQFFYSESTLYVMVADSGNAQTDFADWFETASLYGEGSPLIVVLNEFSDGIGYGTFAEDQWKSQFPSLIKEVHLVNLLKQKDISLLERDIKHFARQLPHVQYEFPTNWTNIRAELERRRNKNFISFQEYLRICKENNLPERNSALILSSVLHKIGVCLHYQKSELLSQHIILKNEWATTAVYKILEDHTIAEVKKGFFDVEDLRRIWSDTEYQDMIPQLLALMREFKLAYPLPVINEYVAPPLLPQAQPRDIEISETNAIQVMLEFEFLPKALMTQFIVSRHKDIDHNRTMVWRDGVVLRWPSNTRAIIRKLKSRGRDAFQILVTGTEQRGLLTSIIKTLRDLCDEYKGIRVQEIVKCHCEGCLSGRNEQHFFDFKNLTHRLEKGRKTVECDKSLEEVDLLKLLGSLFIFEEIRSGQKLELKDVQSNQNNNNEYTMKKVFISYSKSDKHYRDEIEKHLSVQRRNGTISIWTDRELLPGEKWDGKIKQELKEADIILFLVSVDFLATDYIWDVELGTALERDNDPNDAVSVVPIILRKCDWIDSPLGKFNSPVKGKDISTASDKDEAIYEIVKELKELI